MYFSKVSWHFVIGFISSSSDSTYFLFLVILVLELTFFVFLHFFSIIFIGCNFEVGQSGCCFNLIENFLNKMPIVVLILKNDSKRIKQFPVVKILKPLYYINDAIFFSLFIYIDLLLEPMIIKSLYLFTLIAMIIYFSTKLNSCILFHFYVFFVSFLYPWRTKNIFSFIADMYLISWLWSRLCYKLKVKKNTYNAKTPVRSADVSIFLQNVRVIRQKKKTLFQSNVIRTVITILQLFF